MIRQSMHKGIPVLFVLLVMGSVMNTRDVAAQVNSWEASYFDNAQLEGRPVVRIFESSIDHQWGTGAPNASSALPADFFSVRWIGQVVENSGQDYRLTAVADDNIRVFVNADLVIDNWTATPGATTEVIIGLGRGTHTVRVEYREWAANAFAKFTIAPASSAPPADTTPAPAPPPPSSGNDGECVIPESGPWPPCATGGGAPPPAVDGDCVIPPSGPWPSCATEGSAPPPAPAPPSEPTQPIVVGGDVRGYYAFDEASGANVVDSAAGNTGTINTNVSRIVGPRGNALRIGGQGSLFIGSNSNLDLGTSDFSIGMWLKVSNNSGVQRIFDRRATSPSLVGYHMFTWDGNIGLQLADGNGDVPKCKFDAGTPQCTNYITNHFVADGNWHFVMVTVDRDQSSGLRFYVDGSLVAQMDPTDRQGSLSSGQAIPFVMDSNGAPLDVDELYIYGRAISANEVATLFNNR